MTTAGADSPPWWPGRGHVPRTRQVLADDWGKAMRKIGTLNFKRGTKTSENTVGSHCRWDTRWELCLQNKARTSLIEQSMRPGRHWDHGLPPFCSCWQPGPKSTDGAYSPNGVSPYSVMEPSFGRSSLNRVVTLLNGMKSKDLYGIGKSCPWGHIFLDPLITKLDQLT